MSPQEQRKYWLNALLKIGHPVLCALSEQKLKSIMPLDFHEDRAAYAPLEALGRLACGMAPWLELNCLTGEEEKLRSHYAALMHKAIDAATSPASNDYMVFDGAKSRQPLVDAAFLCHAFLRAPNTLIRNMDSKTKDNVIAALKLARKIQPWNSNWLLFGAMVETGLNLLYEGYDYNDYDKDKINDYVEKILSWYKGDGVYGDGPEFRFDYYNSFVIHPMLVDIVSNFSDRYADINYVDIKEIVLARAQRYASILERMISPEGTYPIVGRSITYRFGAFQLLSQAALSRFLEKDLPPAQVRSALTSVIQRTMDCGNIFDDSGWLRPGVCGFQPDLAESYINTGSLYLCASVFLPLGLAPDDEFWSDPNMRWTSYKVFSGENVPMDKAIDV